MAGRVTGTVRGRPFELAAHDGRVDLTLPSIAAARSAKQLWHATHPRVRDWLLRSGLPVTLKVARLPRVELSPGPNALIRHWLRG